MEYSRSEYIGGEGKGAEDWMNVEILQYLGFGRWASKEDQEEVVPETGGKLGEWSILDSKEVINKLEVIACVKCCLKGLLVWGLGVTIEFEKIKSLAA